MRQASSASLLFSQRGLGAVHIIGQQVGGEHVVPMRLEPLTNRAAGQNPAALTANRTR
jgi:hypothetical protein